MMMEFIPASALPLAKSALENTNGSVCDVQLGDLIRSNQRPVRSSQAYHVDQSAH